MLGLLSRGWQVDVGQVVPSATYHGCFAAQHLLSHILREAVWRKAQFALEQRDHRFRERDLAGRVTHLLRLEVVGDHEQGHVAHHFGGGGDFEDVAK